ncbi:MFS transporter [Micromonospora cathayae]|uniref:Multidrug efflux pump Tap n=1 Tax=Micromonospora cathayae TaxID=3028804 RepID=A0ABY7ZI70_9ACTN|nr:MFS transporter [Micromonospora sp. HUAS 3]WDZ82203.1 MFS transporter [Micromonospora sp. HUAS 3]
MNRVSSVYLASYLLSLLGNAIAGVVLPLLVLQITGSVLATGAVAVASALPAAVAGLVMGVVIDKINRRTASVITDVVSALSIAALPLVDATVGLALGWFVLFAVIGSFGDVPGMTAREAMIPGIVRAGRMGAERLLGLRESLGAVVMLVGPAAGAALIAVFDGVTVLWVTAATSAAAAAVTMLIPREAGAIPVAEDGPQRVVLRDGWHTLVRSPFLLTTTLISVGLVVVLAGFQALVLPVYFTLEQRPEMLGLVLSSLAVGLLIGGGTYAAAGARGPRRAWFLTGMLITIAGFGAMATLAGPWFVLGAAALVGLGNGLFGSLMGVLMVERIPDATRGRVMGLQNSIITLAPAIGMGGTAVLVDQSGARTGAVVLAVVWLVTGVVALGVRALRDLEPHPGPEAELVR